MASQNDLTNPLVEQNDSIDIQTEQTESTNPSAEKNDSIDIQTEQLPNNDMEQLIKLMMASIGSKLDNLEPGVNPISQIIKIADSVTNEINPVISEKNINIIELLKASSNVAQNKH